MNARRILCFLALCAGPGLPATSALAVPNTVQFSPVSYTVAENTASGSVTLTVTATRRGDPSETITVQYATSPGSALSGMDFTSVSDTVTFGPGQVERTISVPIINDNQLEDAENFTVNLSDPSSGTSVGSGTATVTISDDDSQASTVRFEASSYSVNESGQTVTLTVTRSGGLGLEASVGYATANGTAIAGSDYSQQSGRVTFFSGQTTATITISVSNDANPEDSEAFSVALNSPSINATLGSPSTATVTILDDDGMGSTVQFNPTSYTVAENIASGSVTLSVTATRRGDPNETITVQYATNSGTAISGMDYSFVSGSVTFGPGQVERTISVPIINDNQLEDAENFTVNLSSPTSGTSLGSGAATVIISDDDSQTSTVRFEASSYSVSEFRQRVTLTVTRSGGLGLEASVGYATANGTAIAGSDYSQQSGRVTLFSGQTTATIEIPISDDANQESSEAFSVALNSPSINATLGNPSTATVTILDDDGTGSTVQFSPTSYSANETPGNSTVMLAITATRLGDPNASITVSYATSNGSAAAGSDYLASTGSVVFGPSETQKLISITILNDDLIENGENFFVSLTNATNASISGAPATVTIADDDSPTASIGFSASSYNVDEGAGSVTLTVTRSGGRSFAATVNYATADGSAKAGVNYATSNGRVNFLPGETTKTIQVPIIDEGTSDPTLQFTVTLTDPNNTGFVGGQSTAAVNILDNDGNIFRFETANYTVNEGAGVVTLRVVAIRAGDTTQQITVDYVTTDGTAAEGSKYSRTAGRLTFEANVTAQMITVPIIDEGFIEGTTNFNVVLSNPRPPTAQGGNSASKLGTPSTATVSIVDNDARTFQFSSSIYTVENSNGTANVFVTFSRVGDFSSTYTVDYATTDDTAVAGRDYTSTSGTLTFGPGETSQSISIPLTPQPVGQPTRQFRVSLLHPSPGAELGQTAVAAVVITNPDFSTKIGNISTRGPVQSGENVMIAGFIITGDTSKDVVLRGIGPSLTQLGVAGAINDPTLTLVDSNGTQLAFNDNYRTNSQADRATLAATELTPQDTREAALVVSLAPANYTVILRSATNGVGLVEIYDIEGTAGSRFANISTRGKVEEGDNGAMIAGFIIAAPGDQPGTPQRVVLRATGPSLRSAGISNALADTTLDLYRGSRLILSNDNWRSNSASDQQELRSYNLAPGNDREAALVVTLDPGSYSAVVRGKNNTTGVALVEVYRLD